MVLKEAIEILEGLIEPQSTLLGSFDKEAVKTVLAELGKQKQVKAEMRKVAWEEGYNQGYLAGIRAVTLDDAGLDDEED